MDDIATLEMRFLEQACRNVQGDTSKNLMITEIAKSLLLDESSEEYPPETIFIIVESLKSKHFIEEGDTNDQVKVTREGINCIISSGKEPATNFGVISVNEVNSLYPRILEFLYLRTEDTPQKGVLLSEIKEETLNPYSQMVLFQMIDFLKDKNFVEVMDNTVPGPAAEPLVKITTKGTREINRQTQDEFDCESKMS
jgi:hypothetical protein